MDMTRYTQTGDTEWKLRKHTKAIRENQLSVAFMLLALNGYECDMHRTDKPNASFAKECLDELDMEGQVGVWSCSTKAGGIWTTEQRRMLKYGF